MRLSADAHFLCAAFHGWALQFPTRGNGGYDVAGYNVNLSYDPSTSTLPDTATINATAIQGLSRFDFDLVKLAASVFTASVIAAARNPGQLIYRLLSMEVSGTIVPRSTGAPPILEN